LNQPKLRTRIGVRIEPLNKQDVFLKSNRLQQESFSLDDKSIEDGQDRSSSNFGHDSLFDNDQSQKKKAFSKKKKTKVNV
jgi:hypothetical protein